MVHCPMRVAMLLQITVRLPTIRYYWGAWLDPCSDYWQQSCFILFVNYHHITVPALILYTNKHPLSLFVMSAMIFALPKFALINLHCLSLASNSFTVFQQCNFTYFLGEAPSQRQCCCIGLARALSATD